MRRAIELDDVHEEGPASARCGLVELRQHPIPVRHAGRCGLGHADDRDIGGARQIDEVLHHIVRRLLVVEQDAHLVGLQVPLERGDVARARLGIVHDGELEALVGHFQPQRVRHVAKDRLARGHRRAGIFAANGGDLFVQRRERGEEGFQPRRIIVLVGRVGGWRVRQRARSRRPASWPDRTRGADCRRAFCARDRRRQSSRARAWPLPARVSRSTDRSRRRYR